MQGLVRTKKNIPTVTSRSRASVSHPHYDRFHHLRGSVLSHGNWTSCLRDGKQGAVLYRLSVLDVLVQPICKTKQGVHMYEKEGGGDHLQLT